MLSATTGCYSKYLLLHISWDVTNMMRAEVVAEKGGVGASTSLHSLKLSTYLAFK